jgi:hypothetical protein
MDVRWVVLYVYKASSRWNYLVQLVAFLPWKLLGNSGLLCEKFWFGGKVMLLWVLVWLLIHLITSGRGKIPFYLFFGGNGIFLICRKAVGGGWETAQHYFRVMLMSADLWASS